MRRPAKGRRKKGCVVGMVSRAWLGPGMQSGAATQQDLRVLVSSSFTRSPLVPCLPAPDAAHTPTPLCPPTYQAQLLHDGVHAGWDHAQVLPAHKHVGGPHQRRQRAVRLLAPQRILRATRRGELCVASGTQPSRPWLLTCERHNRLAGCRDLHAPPVPLGPSVPPAPRRHLSVVEVVVVQAQQLVPPVLFQGGEAGGGVQGKALRRQEGRAGSGAALSAHAARAALAGAAAAGLSIPAPHWALRTWATACCWHAHRVESVGVLRVPQQHHVLPQHEQPAPHRIRLALGPVASQTATRRQLRNGLLAAQHTRWGQKREAVRGGGHYGSSALDYRRHRSRSAVAPHIASRMRTNHEMPCLHAPTLRHSLQALPPHLAYILRKRYRPPTCSCRYRAATSGASSAPNVSRSTSSVIHGSHRRSKSQMPRDSSSCRGRGRVRWAGVWLRTFWQWRCCVGSWARELGKGAGPREGGSTAGTASATQINPGAAGERSARRSVGSACPPHVSCEGQGGAEAAQYAGAAVCGDLPDAKEAKDVIDAVCVEVPAATVHGAATMMKVEVAAGEHLGVLLESLSCGQPTSTTSPLPAPCWTGAQLPSPAPLTRPCAQAGGATRGTRPWPSPPSCRWGSPSSGRWGQSSRVGRLGAGRQCRGV
jgi:hypothetical protein